MVRAFEALPKEEQEFYRKVFSGEAVAPLYSDTIAKNIFNADAHPERLNFLLRSIARDNSIDVRSSAANEGFRQSVHAKGMVSDIPAWLKDNRLSNLEVQQEARNYLFTRMDLYASDMLLLQYSVVPGQNKGEVDYANVCDVLLVVLMVNSPRTFKAFDKASRHYIHRFAERVADTGLSYPSKARIIYVQLDKCLKQFKAGKNAESADGKPDKLQRWLAMIADANDTNVSDAIAADEELKQIRAEVFNMAQDKEVQNMLLQEKFERMDWVSYGNDRERDGKEEGIKEGKREGEIVGVIKLYHDEQHLATAEIVSKIMKRFDLTKEEAEGYVKETLVLQ